MRTIKQYLNAYLLMIINVVLISTTSFAVEDAENKKCEIKGKVIDQDNNTALEYVTVTIYQLKDSAFVTGGITQADGVFTITDLEMNAHYYAAIRFIGYAEQVIADINTIKKTTDLGSIFLSAKAQNMDEFVVEDEKGFVEHKIDKKVFNIDKMIVDGTALDVLRDLPSIEVDENDNIMFRGQEGVTILVDGRPTSMAASTYLKMIASNAVEKVEVIANPSAKYDAEGMSGIINIITKKERQAGFNGNLYGQYGRSVNNRYNGSINLNYNSKKVNVHLGHNADQHSASTSSYTRRDLFVNDTLVDRLISNGIGLNSSKTFVYSGGVDYFINKKNTIYVAGKYNTGNLTMDNDIVYENMNENDYLLSSSTRETDEYGPQGSNNINAGWQSTFWERNSTLDLDVDYSTDFHETNEKIIENILGSDYFETTTYGLEKNKLLVGKMDFMFPISDSISIETGLKGTSRIQNADLSFNTIKNGNQGNAYLFDNEFNYDETILAGYISYAHQLNKFSFKLGFRGENTVAKSSEIQDNYNVTKNYFQLFPSAFLSYKFSDTTNITLSYGRRINRPRMNMINPFIYYSDRFLVEQGDPGLIPETIHITELAYSFYSQKITVDASVYFRYIKDKIRRHMWQDSLVSVIGYKNIEKSYMAGVESSITYKPIKALRIRYTINFWGYQINDEVITNNITSNTTGTVMNLDFLVQLKKGWRLQLRNYYNPKHSIQQGYMYTRYVMAFGVGRAFFDKKLKVNFIVRDVLNTLNSHFQSTNSSNYDFEGNWEWESRIVRLSASYTFGSKFKGKKKRQQLNISNDDSSIPDI